jgi:hypothetical protein
MLPEACRSIALSVPERIEHDHDASHVGLT